MRRWRNTAAIRSRSCGRIGKPASSGPVLDLTLVDPSRRSTQKTRSAQNLKLQSWNTSRCADHQLPVGTADCGPVVRPLAYARGMQTDKDRLNAITERIIGAAIDVHHELGPGMLESAYEACLAHELTKRGLAIERQKPLPFVDKGQRIDCGFRLDLLVEQAVVVEIKSIARFEGVHSAQV